MGPRLEPRTLTSIETRERDLPHGTQQERGDDHRERNAHAERMRHP